MSVTCEICGKEFKNSQGLRGHKTFVHGLRANSSRPTATIGHTQWGDATGSPFEYEGSGASEYRERINKMESEVVSNTELLTDLRRTVRALQNQLALMATASEINLIATKVDLIGKSVEKHERWFNPKNIDETVLRFCGGPIASLEKRLDRLHPIKLLGRKDSAVKYRG